MSNSRAYLINLDRLFFNVVCNKINLSVTVFEILDNSVKNAVCILDNRFNFTRLDTLTVYFYHPVFTVQINIIAVFTLFADVACTEQFRETVFFIKRIVNKSLCGLFGHIQITVCKISRKADFTFINRIVIFIKKIYFHISDRLAYGCIVILFIYLKHHDRTCGFRLTVGDLNFIIFAVCIGNSFTAC